MWSLNCKYVEWLSEAWENVNKDKDWGWWASFLKKKKAIKQLFDKECLSWPMSILNTQKGEFCVLNFFFSVSTEKTDLAHVAT